MKKTTPDFETLRALHQKGELDSAKAGYLQVLKKQSNNVEALHALGIIYAQQENYSEAIRYLQLAVKLHPKNLSYSLHLANILKFQELYDQAIHVLENALKQDPDFIPAINNLGTIYYTQGNLQEAIRYYRLAIAKQPHYVDAYYNLGLTLAKQNIWAEAQKAYEKIIELSPEHMAGRFQLACIMLQQNKISEAIELFLQIEITHPNHFETQSNLATAYLKQGNLQEAKKHYLAALELDQTDSQILFNLGVIHTQQDQLDVAIQFYQRAAELNPDNFAIHNNLGVAFLTKQHVAFAVRHFQEALRIQPDNKAIQHTIGFLSQNQQLLTSPPDYITSLFDAYADHYEPHLLKALDYKLPDLLLNAVLVIQPLAPNTLSILDLGCGTGLCGQVFKTYAHTLVGVDLSTKMLDVAAGKNIYTQLVPDDITHFLSNNNAAYDLILAGDVFVYMGDLTTVFNEISKNLAPNGFFAFNTEISLDDDFKVNQSGRFAHSNIYLERLAEQFHLTCAQHQKIVTRMQNNEPVYGYLFILQKGT
jgi:predicted TPR repeat methyltransferase